jgi:hypothetical protein
MKNNIAEKKLVGLLREAYTQRLNRVLSEVDIVDKEGNVIISKDLKVRHKKSGFEYTVDSVQQAGKDIKVVLRKPEEPRVEDPGEAGVIPASTPKQEMIQDADLRAKMPSAKMPRAKAPPAKQGPKMPPLPHEVPGDDSPVFVVDKKEFEKEYTVE